MDLTRFEGLTIEDLEAAIVAMREAEEAKAREEEAKAEAHLAELRINLLDAATQYLLALGAISEEDVQAMDVSSEMERRADHLLGERYRVQQKRKNASLLARFGFGTMSYGAAFLPAIGVRVAGDGLDKFLSKMGL